MSALSQSDETRGTDLREVSGESAVGGVSKLDMIALLFWTISCVNAGAASATTGHTDESLQGAIFVSVFTASVAIVAWLIHA